MKKTYVKAELMVVSLGAEDIMNLSGLKPLDPNLNPILDNLDVNELPIF